MGNHYPTLGYQILLDISLKWFNFYLMADLGIESSVETFEITMASKAVCQFDQSHDFNSLYIFCGIEDKLLTTAILSVTIAT